MGGIIAWPKDSNPSTSSNIWLECNGQSFDTNRFPKLYKVLGSSKVPNYQGMFLRGAGSQSFTQYSGSQVGNATIVYSSGGIGEIQGDAMRLVAGQSFGRFLSLIDPSSAATFNIVPEFNDGGGSTWLFETQRPYNSWAHMYSPAVFAPFGCISSPINIRFVHTPKHYKYRLNYSTSTDEDGNQVIDNISLDEYTDPADSDEVFDVSATAHDIGFSNVVNTPIADEVRPINVAVKYYIRAK